MSWIGTVGPAQDPKLEPPRQLEESERYWVARLMIRETISRYQNCLARALVRTSETPGVGGSGAEKLPFAAALAP